VIDKAANVGDAERLGGAQSSTSSSSTRTRCHMPERTTATFLGTAATNAPPASCAQEDGEMANDKT